MAKETAIEYSDSTLNCEIGCAGCELYTANPVGECEWCRNPLYGSAIEIQGDKFMHFPANGSNPTLLIAQECQKKNIRTCYAGQLVTRYAGQKGYPEAFDKPKLFLNRLLDAAKWPDLRGKDRLETRHIIAKPWLNGLPRFIFLNDLGDTFTEGLPRDWLGTPALELAGCSPLQVLAQMKAIIMVLTKRATQMRQFFERYECPQNFIVMTSITGPETISRVREILKIKARWHGVSVEPILRDTTDAIEPFLGQLSWAAVGAESGQGKRRYDLKHFRTFRDVCAKSGTRLFVKQIDKVAAIPPDLLIRQLPDFTLEPAIA